jgi:hypothetical protein
MLLTGASLLMAALTSAVAPHSTTPCTLVSRPMAPGPLSGPPSCAFRGGHFGGSGKAPRGYERFECFPTAFYFRPGTSTLVEPPSDVSRTNWFKYTRSADEWVVLTLVARSAAGDPIGPSMLNRRAKAILDWLFARGHRRDRVEIWLAPYETSGLMERAPDGGGMEAEFSGYVTGMLPAAKAEDIRQTIKAHSNIIYC